MADDTAEAGDALTRLTLRMVRHLRWTVGLGLAPLGASFGVGHEAAHWRVGAALRTDADDLVFLGIEAAWIARTSSVSPYAAIAFGAVHEEIDAAGVKLEVGVELLRRQRVHVFAGANVVLTFDGTNRMVNPGLHIRLGL